MFDIQKFLQEARARGDKRRLDRRMPYRQSVHFRVDKGPFQKAQLEDVSGGGFRVTLPRYIPNGAKLQILYNQPLSSRQFWVEGKVRWSREIETRYSTGVEIKFQSESDEAPYQDLLAQLETAC
ncbi:MAG: PilZ domain-containing protein [Vulcanimicrobiota bacterium]